MTDKCDHGSGSCSSCGSGPAQNPPKKGGPSAQELDDELKIQSRLDQIKHKVVVLSGKGGVGKSTVAVNLASALADSGKNVGLLDVDIHGPSVPKMLGMEDAPVEAADNTIQPVQTLWNLKMMSIAFFLKQMDAVIWRGPLKMGVIKQFLRDVEWGELDYLIVDCPPGTGDEPLSVAQLLVNPSGAVVVTTPQDVATSAVKRSASFCNQLKMKVLGIVENMSGYVCPDCGHKVDLFGKEGGKMLAEATDSELLASIPLSAEMVPAGDSGRPVALNKDSKIGKIYRELANRIDSKLEG